MLDKRKMALIFAAALASGLVIGTATELAIAKWKERHEEACPDDEDWDEEDDGYYSYDEEDLTSPEIPEGVNVVSDVVDKVVNDKMFVKPDISKMIDYTKYSDAAKRYGESESEPAKIVMPDDEDAPEAYDDDRFELIDEQEFVREVGNLNGFVSATGTYFVQDKVLAGWNEDLREKDISTTVGWRAIRMFDEPDVKAVYVRNNDLKVLYEIVRGEDTMESAIQESLKMDISEIQEE
jgi:hypothetical protein